MLDLLKNKYNKNSVQYNRKLMNNRKSIIDLDQYQILFLIGEGAFSKVYRVKDLKTNEFYAAKICNFMVDEETKDSQETLLLFREVNLMSLLNHPAIIKFIGYSQNDFDGDPCPIILTEFASNGSLRSLIEMEQSGLSPPEWNETKKLIIIYGIAAGMSYLHSNKVLHRDLKPENILIDDFLHPKISDFGLSKILDFLSVSMIVQSQKGTKGTPIYMSPEAFEEEYSNASDVYAFAIIVYEIVSGERPFNEPNMTFMKIYLKIKEGYRPELNSCIPEAYRELIENCWAQSPDDRLSFDEIVNCLKTNEDFITDLIDKNEFLDYVDFIDDAKSSFEKSKQMFHFDDFIKAHGRNKVLQKVTLTSSMEETNDKYFKRSVKNAAKLKEEESDEDQNMPKKDKKESNESKNKNKKDKKESDEVQNKPIKDKKESYEDQNKPKKVKKESYESKNKHKKVKKESNEDQNKHKKVKKESNESKNKHIKVKEELIESSDKPDKIREESNESINKLDKVKKEGTNDYNSMNEDIPNNSENEESISEAEDTNSKQVKSIIFDKTQIPFYSPDFDDLNEENQNLVNRTTSDKENQFIVGKNLIEGLHDFSQNISVGMKYLMKSVSNRCINAICYYIRILIKGELVLQDLEKADEYLQNIKKDIGGLYYYFLGKILYKKSQYKNAKKSFDKGASKKNLECMYESGKMLFLGEGVSRNIKKALALIETSKKKNFEKSEHFLTTFQKLAKLEGFNNLPSYTQFLFISNGIKNLKRNNNSQSEDLILNKIDIGYSKTEMLFFNESLKSNDFHKILKNYKEITISIQYPSKTFQAIFNLVSKIQKDIIDNIKVFIIFSDIPSKDSDIYKYQNIFEYSIDPSIISFSFKKCSSLTKMSIPSSVTKIGDYAFEECILLTQISIPSSVTEIGNYSFYKCSSLTKISIPSSVTLIGNGAFRGCSSLTKISIPSSVTKIGDYVFEECSSLTNISIPSSIIEINSRTFEGCSSLTKISIPSSVTIIKDMAFEGCSSLKRVTIPSSVIHICPKVFNGCSSLTKISIPPSVAYFGSNAFDGVVSLEITGDIKCIRSESFKVCYSLTKITIPSSVTKIEPYAFFGCSFLTQISNLSSVTEIGYYAFDGCSSLTQISIPSVTLIEEYTFSGCYSLTQITLSSSLQKIGEYAFYKCKSLAQISFPSSVNKIGKYAFYECSSLKEISIPYIREIESYTFSGCTSLIQITIPSYVSSIGSSAFKYCSSLKEISIPSSVRSIGDCAFLGCSSLTQISISSSVTEIKECTFLSCESLKKVTFLEPSSVTSFGKSAFSSCKNLSQILIPSSVKSIEDNAFSYCYYLMKLTIPSSVTSLGKDVFKDCNYLTLSIPSSLDIRNKGIDPKIKIIRI